MAVKLLPKSQLQEQKARETTREIQEGLKLANRVDGLRKTYSDVEQGLEKYGIATLTQIQGEIAAEQKKFEEISGKTRAMQAKYDAMIPEISMKRTELYQFERTLEKWEQKLEKRQEVVDLGEIDIAEAKQKAKDSLKRQEDNERIARNLLIEADKKKNEAEVTLITARKVSDKAYSDQKSMEASLNLREFSIQSQEKEILTKETQLMNDRKDLEQEKIRVKDQRETLKRSLERIKAGRLA